MKRIIFTSLLGIAALGIKAQLPVSTLPENKNVILEEFTGIHCVYCPDGHKRANQLADSHPGDVFLINIHAGGYANPSEGEPDFRTEFGEAIDDQSNLAGYPAGTINRHVFAGLSMNPGGTAMSRGDWTSASNIILAEASYVNVALEGIIDVSTNELTVNVELYFTSTAPGPVNLNVALTQNNIEGPQTGAETYYPEQILPNGNYVHNHMLRHLLTGQWGEVITTISAGTKVSKQYIYTLPDNINGIDVAVENLNVIAFVAEGQQEIISGSKGPISFSGLLTNNTKLESVDAFDEICGSTLDISLAFKNMGTANLTSAQIIYGFEGTDSSIYNWTGNIATFQKQEIRLPRINVPEDGGLLEVYIYKANEEVISDISNNIISQNVSKTTHYGNGKKYKVTIVQDRYGSELSWEIKNASGQPVASGGPYADLPATGILTHIEDVTLDAEGCFTFFMYDSYGDGFDSGYGVGSYKLENTVGELVLEGDGKIGKSRRMPLQVLSLESPENSILSYTFGLTDETDTVIDPDRQILIELPGGINITTLVATFTISDGANIYVDGIEQITGITENDFSDTVEYTIISESGTEAVWSVVVTQETGIHNKAIEKLNIFPNPTQEILFIQNLNKGNIEIYDIVGKKVLTNIITETNSSLDVSTLINGTYFIVGISENKVFKNKFTIIK